MRIRTWTAGDPEPGPEVTAVRDQDLDVWYRVPGGWVCRRPDSSPASWHSVLGFAGPLVDATAESGAVPEMTPERWLDAQLDTLPTPQWPTAAAYVACWGSMDGESGGGERLPVREPRVGAPFGGVSPWPVIPEGVL